MKPVERVEIIIKFKGVSISAFEKATGMSNNSIQTAIKRVSNLKDDTLNSILNCFPDISAEWLLTGKGSMLKDDFKVFPLKTDNTIENQAIPLYNLEATAGIVTLFKDNHEIEPIDYIQIPNLPKCDGAVHISGDSMYPLLKSGDIVMYKQVHDIKDGIYWGEMYLVSIQDNGDEMVMVKYIKKSEREGYIKLVSQNKHHEDREVLLKKVKALALIKASIRINSMS